MKLSVVPAVIFMGLFLLSNAATAAGLYDPEKFRPLTADRRALGVGDALTVVVVEVSSAESSANTASKSGFGVDAGLLDASGPARAGVSIDSDSSATGKTTRAGSVTAQLSVRVEDVTDTGNLFVHGEQLIKVNGEQQRIEVEGYVRPIDISADNVVLSTRLVNAKIEYSGRGWVSRNQEPGLFARLLRFIGF